MRKKIIYLYCLLSGGIVTGQELAVADRLPADGKEGRYVERAANQSLLYMGELEPRYLNRLVVLSPDRQLHVLIPSERVGFVEVAATTKKSRFISNTETDFYVDPQELCYIMSNPGEGMFPWVDYDKGTYSSWRCVDCRKRYNATKNKPSWWPTDHL